MPSEVLVTQLGSSIRYLLSVALRPDSKGRTLKEMVDAYSDHTFPG